MNDYELPSFDDDEPAPVEQLTKRAENATKIDTLSPVQIDTSTSVHTIPERMTAVPVKCRCGGKLGYRDPNTPRIWCGGCGRNL